MIEVFNFIFGISNLLELLLLITKTYDVNEIFYLILQSNNSKFLD